MARRFSSSERVLLAAVFSDVLIGTPIVLLGFASGAASATSEGIRAMLLVGIDVFSVCILLAVNRQKFSQFEFGIEKVQILVQIGIAIGMFVSVLFIGSKVYRAFTAEAEPPDYVYCVVFALVSYVNLLVNLFNLRRMVVQERLAPSIIVRGQIKNRTIMVTSSIVATFSAAAVIIPDQKLFAMIDAVGAILVLCVIVYTMVHMMRSGVLTLLDAPIDEQDKLLVFREVAEYFESWSWISFVRTRRLGYSKYIEVGLCFDSAMNVDAVLATCGAIERGINRSIANAFVSVFPVSQDAPQS